MGSEMLLIVFLVLGIGLAFIIVWIMKSEKAREIYENEIRRMKRQFESKEREISMLIDKLEVSELALNDFEDSGRIKSFNETEHETAGGIVIDMKNRLSELEGENDKLGTELTEARDSLEEVYNAMCN